MKRMHIKWTDHEREILKFNYESLGAAGCAVLLPGRTPEKIRAMASIVGVSKALFASTKERFESKFTVTPGCWIWIGGKDKYGYGQFGEGGRNYRAHRYSYELYVGPIPDGLCACHKCDNPSCVNPDHLWPGDDKQNAEDRTAKGRSAKQNGEKNGLSKLTDGQVLEIRSAQGLQRELAEQYGVDQSLISLIKRKKVWAHIPDKAECIN